ncbi:hypothetical protein NQ317_000302 [Molorchus minor]|uniref:Uncharacterized protein n=1 Tax=Molorchus minor TaxID=1323400 RepID=A0ABQ9IRL9_9CUCU|nr:hypothetical protein NQ317_000302 [Molorchus minor]
MDKRKWAFLGTTKTWLVWGLDIRENAASLEFIPTHKVQDIPVNKLNVNVGAAIIYLNLSYLGTHNHLPIKMSLSPWLKSPFTDLTGSVVTHQWFGACADMELKALDCIEAYGLDRGLKVCDIPDPGF